MICRSAVQMYIFFINNPEANLDPGPDANLDPGPNPKLRLKTDPDPNNNKKNRIQNTAYPLDIKVLKRI
jgi:hypothetical protein